MIDTIYRRKSVRNFENIPLSKSDYDFVLQEIQSLSTNSGPFKNRFDFFFLENKEGSPDSARRIGTYGFIKNPYAFIGGPSLIDFKSMVDYGYVLEHFILNLTGTGIGTVWLGGTFQRDVLSDILNPDQIIPCIIAIGYEANKKHLKERIIRNVIQANSRKPFNHLFFDEEWSIPISKDHSLAKVFDLVRVAPSASNKQPWRILLKKDKIHLFLERTPNYGNMLNFDIQAIDMGIALCHLELGLQELHIDNSFVEDLTVSADNLVYVISVQLEL